MNENDVLAHFGVKGMRWGVRRTPEQLGHRIDKRSEDSKEVANLRKSSVKSLSNKELEKIIKRMNLERQYDDLRRREIESGHQFVNSVTKYATTAASIYMLTKSPAATAVKSAFDNLFKFGIYNVH